MSKLIDTNKVKEHINLQNNFGRHVVNKNAITDTMYGDADEIKNKIQISKDNIAAMDPQNNLELLLASQMMSIHNFQQRLMSYAINAQLIDTSIKYGNLVAKLSNVFIQQVNLMQRLKGDGGKKVVFEHIHIHSGGKAVVGTINTSTTPPPTSGDNL